MSAITAGLHSAFVNALDGRLLQHSSLNDKPLLLDLKLPSPPRLRLYMYSLVAGGAYRKDEYKSVLRVPNQPVGEYGSFDHSDDRFILLVGFEASLDVFVLWDASLHYQFKNGGNIQVRQTTVLRAAASGFAQQRRTLGGRRKEVVYACQSTTLLDVLDKRLGSTGLVEDSGTWQVLQT